MPRQSRNLRERILDTALAQAESASWERVRLHNVAQAMDISLDEVRRHYPQKDDLVEAWFDRADRAMLAHVPNDEFPALPLAERLYRVIEQWLDALGEHRRVTRQMLAYKLEPGHVHLQALGVMRISRTVQWFHEAAGQDSTGVQRIVDECALTTMYLTVFARWLFDTSEDQRNSKRTLRSALGRWPGFAGGGRRHEAEQEAAGENSPQS